MARPLPAWPARRRLAGPTATTHTLHGVHDLGAEHLVLADGTLVGVLSAAALPLTLRGEAEQALLIESLRLALTTLNFPLQLLVEVGALDVDAYCIAHAQATAAEPEPALRHLAEDHRAFVRDLAHQRRLLERRVFLVVAVPALADPSCGQRGLARLLAPPPPAPRRPPAEALQELNHRCATLDGRLRASGISLHRLSGPELAGLLYRLLRPGLASRQPLPASALDLASGPVLAPAHQPRAGQAARGAAPAGLSAGGRSPAATRTAASGGRVLTDLLAPSASSEAADWLQVEDRYCLTLAVIGYPRAVGADWLDAVWRCGLPLRVALHLDPIDAAAALRQLERQRTRLEGNAATAARQGRATRTAAEVAFEDVVSLQHTIGRHTERLLDLACYLTVEAESPTQLTAAAHQLETTLGSLGLHSVRLRHEQLSAFRATLPLGRDEPLHRHPMTAAAVAATFPFAAAAGGGGDNVLLGVDPVGGGLVEFPLFVPGDSNVLWLGPSGSGKSYAVKHTLLGSLLLGATVWILDREGEYRPLAEAVGGRIIRLAPGAGGAGLNPLDLPPPLPDDEATGADPIAERIDAVTTLLGLLIGEPAGGLTQREQVVVERALRATYAAFGVTPDPATQTNMPTLADLQARLADGDETSRELAARLERFTHGAYAGLFARRTDVATHGRLLLFDIVGLPESLHTVGIFLLADAMWTQARRRRANRILVVDEAAPLIAHPAGGRFFADLAARARKHNLALWTITQEVRRLLAETNGLTIVANSSRHLLFRQNPRTIAWVADAFQLGDGERALLLSGRTGEALLGADGQRRAVTVLAAPTEDDLITTDPQELLRREQARQALWQGASVPLLPPGGQRRAMAADTET